MNIVFADAAIVVVDKPAGLLAVPGRGPDKADCVVARLQATHPGARTVHRLDMATSGLLVHARDADVHRTLSRAFAERRVAKTYIAVVRGVVAGDAGEIDLPLAADWPNRPKQVVDRERGRPAFTRWRVLDRARDRTRVELEPVTGRAHQLRVHLLAIGHPILGDALYGNTAAPRLLLHAAALGFDHPISGEPMRFTSRVPF